MLRQIPYKMINNIERNRYLKRLVSLRDNGQVKIITGIRRCGKSFLLNTLFRNYLLKEGVKAEQIIMIELDNDSNIRYRNPIELGNYVRTLTANKRKQYYVVLDEIQKVASVPNPYLPKGTEERIGFVDVLNGLRSQPNIDLYVTGSNSKMLSSDIATEFRGRGDIVQLSPLTFDEFYAAYPSNKRLAWREFVTYGGMPKVMSLNSYEEKAKYLTDLFQLIYIADVVERNKLKGDASVLDDLLNIVASSIGSLTNPTRLANTFQSVKHLKIKNETLSRYLDCFVDAFILSKAHRYDIKGKAYIDTPLKYYFSDIGLRNAKINFRQQEENHIMENILFNELTARGFSVDVGVVPIRWKDEEERMRQSMLEVDFIVNKAEKRYYIQSALTISDEEKRLQETNSLNRIADSYQKIVIVKDDILPWTDEKGVKYINIQDFLLSGINNL